MSDEEWIAPAVRLNATDQVRSDLIRAVREGRFPVGTRLPSEGELAQRFKVSRPVIREALGSLRVLGLTSSQPGTGTFVVSSDVKLPLSLGEMSSEDLNEVRLLLEVPAARLAAIRRGRLDLADLRKSIREYAKAEDPVDRVREDVRFHVAIAKASNNALLHHLVAELQSSLREQSLAIAAVSGRRVLSTKEHQLILEGVAEGDAKQAAQAMEAHLLGVHAALEKL